MPIQLKYHDQTIEIPDPPVGEIITLKGNPIAPLPDPRTSLQKAFDHPINSEPLRNMIPSKGSITLMVSDRTRKVRLDIILPVLMDYLSENCVPEERIRILVCLGTHKRHTQEQLEKLIGTEFLKKYKVFESHQDDQSAFVDFGKTPRGTPVRFNRLAVESSLLIAIGNITFHYFAGFSGGRKSFLPGIACEETIQTNHKLTYMKQNGKFVRNPNCASTVLDGNPLSEDMEDAFHLMPVPSFLINTLLNQESDIAGVVAGNVIDAHRNGCDVFTQAYSLPIEKKADIVIASAGGYPTDINLLQSHKSMVSACAALKPGGTLFLSARCSEGVNLEDYPEFVATHKRSELIKKLMQGYRILGGTTDNLMGLAEKFRVFLVSGLESSTLIHLGVKPFDMEHPDWDDVFNGLDGDSTCYVMPNASKYLPIMKS
jgi:nickel-dependent lactate racemase